MFSILLTIFGNAIQDVNQMIYDLFPFAMHVGFFVYFLVFLIDPIHILVD